ncbi:MAG: 50S ribosomal protein L6 [Bacilli bacterium]|nr:50S ribosomal protein L6 [Bacilli bacterium]
MSRIGNKHITLPAGVTVAVEGSNVKVSGAKGSLVVPVNHGISVEVDGSTVVCKRANDLKQTKQNHGTTRANIQNAVIGVSEGYKKSLEMRGIGYKAQLQGSNIVLWGGYSHTVTIKPNEGVKVTLVSPTEIDVEGIDKQAVGQTAARIREVRPPEPYLGKGIRYKDEHVATKEGKRAGGKK